MRFWRIALVLFLAPATARADCFEASSPHFVVYADDTERDVRRFSEQLERYHDAMETVTGRDQEPPSPSNRVTVYVVKNIRQVQRIAGNDMIAGFYIPRAGSSVAFVPQVEVSRREIDSSMATLLHEYAHHFLISNSNFPMPRWLSEGAAEFFSAARFQSDGGLTLGLPARALASFSDPFRDSDDALLSASLLPSLSLDFSLSTFPSAISW